MERYGLLKEKGFTRRKGVGEVSTLKRLRIWKGKNLERLGLWKRKTFGKVRCWKGKDLER